MSRHAMSSKQASQVKRRGHAREREFNRIYGYEDDEINHSGASADCEIREDHKILKELYKHIGTSSRSVSVKGGNTMQFHLGNIPELTNKEQMIVSKHPNGATIVDHGISFEAQIEALTSRTFWNKYLKKGDIMAYSYDDGRHLFFNMDDVIDFIINNITWRKIYTGRLKGDFGKQLLTYEYRAIKKSLNLGASSGEKGREFIEVLKANLRHYIA